MGCGNQHNVHAVQMDRGDSQLSRTKILASAVYPPTIIEGAHVLIKLLGGGIIF